MILATDLITSKTTKHVATDAATAVNKQREIRAEQIESIRDDIIDEKNFEAQPRCGTHETSEKIKQS
ncbi:unnamed protein product, partial [Strongylus vulgaris]